MISLVINSPLKGLMVIGEAELSILLKEALNLAKQSRNVKREYTRF